MLAEVFAFARQASVTSGQGNIGYKYSLSHRVQKTSIHQCLFCCLVYRLIVTIFLNSINMR